MLKAIILGLALSPVAGSTQQGADRLDFLDMRINRLEHLAAEKKVRQIMKVTKLAILYGARAKT